MSICYPVLCIGFNYTIWMISYMYLTLYKKMELNVDLTKIKQFNIFITINIITWPLVFAIIVFINFYDVMPAEISFTANLFLYFSSFN